VEPGAPAQIEAFRGTQALPNVLTAIANRNPCRGAPVTFRSLSLSQLLLSAGTMGSGLTKER
jgi:hypothetical protein